jgi:hypothetical protein
VTAFEVLRREIPSVEECDRQLASCQHTLDNPEQYRRRDWFDARRGLKKWRMRRQAAEALAALETLVKGGVMTNQQVAALMAAHFQAPDTILTEEIPQHVWDDLTERGMILHYRDASGEGTVALSKDGMTALRMALYENATETDRWPGDESDGSMIRAGIDALRDQ